MRMIRWKYFSLICFLWPFFLVGQQTPSQTKIMGLVLANDTNEPLPFARLSVGGNEVGTLCNEQGLFVLKIPPRFQKDSLRVTYLGYQPWVMPVEKLKEDTLIIRLDNQDLTLEAIEILSISPEDTLRRAWRSRGLNYEIHPTLLRGFYRENMEDQNRQIQFLFAEGVLELYKSPYHRNPNDRVRILKGRQKQLPRGYKHQGEDYFLPQITQGPHLGLILDVMKAESSFIRGANQRFYEYIFEKVTYHNNRLTYIFSFSPKNRDNTYSIYQGHIFLDLESLAVVRASYEYTPQGVALYNRTSKELKLISRHFEVNYMEYQDRWYLQDARVENEYHFPPVDRTLYATHTFITTEIINDQISDFPKSEGFQLNEAFVESVEALDEKFWEQYNMVPVKKP